MDNTFSGLRSKDVSEQLHAIQSLKEIATDKSRLKDVGAEMISLLHQLLLSSDDTVRQQATLVLGLIATKSQEHQGEFQNDTFVEQLSQLISNEALQAEAVHIVFALCKTHKISKELTPSFLLSVAKVISSSSNAEILKEACVILTLLSKDPVLLNQGIIDSGVGPRLVELLNHSSHLVQEASLKVLGNIASGEEHHVQVLLNAGLLSNLLSLLRQHSLKESIQREVCWIVSNIAAGSPKQSQATIDAGFIPLLINLLPNTPSTVQREIVWTFGNIADVGTPAQSGFLVSSGVINSLCNLLDSGDNKLLAVVLETLDKILQAGQKEADRNEGNGGTNRYLAAVEEAKGLDKLKALQSHKNRKINEQATLMWESYVEGVDSQPEVVPMDYASGFQF